jgi:hypothetical protein
MDQSTSVNTGSLFQPLGCGYLVSQEMFFCFVQSPKKRMERNFYLKKGMDIKNLWKAFDLIKYIICNVF